MCSNVSQADGIRILVTCWAIWQARRKAIFDGIFQSPLSIMATINRVINELKIVEGFQRIEKGLCNSPKIHIQKSFKFKTFFKSNCINSFLSSTPCDSNSSSDSIIISRTHTSQMQSAPLFLNPSCLPWWLVLTYGKLQKLGLPPMVTVHEEHEAPGCTSLFRFSLPAGPQH